LPNLNGQFSSFGAVINGDGGLFQSKGGDARVSGSQTGGNSLVDFDASRSSSVYSGNGTDTTIHEQAINVLYYIVIANSTKTDIEVDIDEVTTDLNGKVNKSDLQEVQCIIETYQNGTSWYRVWSDGWCEQGSYYSSGIGADTYYSLTFLKPFKDTNYFFTNQVQCNRALGTGWDSGCLDEVQSSRTTAGTEVTTDSISNTKTHYGFRWQACGYIEV